MSPALPRAPRIQTYGVKSWKLQHTMEGHSAKVGCLTTDGLQLFSGSLDQSIRVRVNEHKAAQLVYNAHVVWSRLAV